MARTALARRSSAPNFSRRPSPKLIKLQERVSALSKRARASASNNEDLIVGVATAAAFSMAEKKGVRMPTVAGLDPALLYGMGLYVFAKKIAKGKNGDRVEAIGESLLTLAASRAVQRGGVKVAGEDDDDDDLEDDDDDLSA